MANLKYVSGYSGFRWNDWSVGKDRLVRLLAVIIGAAGVNFLFFQRELIVFSAIWLYGCIALFKSASRKKQPYRRLPKQLGVEGEHFVIDVLDGMLNKRCYIANNILVPNAQSKTGTTEIDVLVVSENRLWCIEVKNYTGFVVATDEKKRWKVLRHQRFVSSMRDPARQVFSQKLALERYLKGKGFNIDVGVLVVFPNAQAGVVGSSFKNIPICRTPGELAKHIKCEQNYRFNQKAVMRSLKPIL